MRKVINAIRKKLISKSKWQEYLRKRGVNIGHGCDIEKSANFGSEPWLIKIGNNTRITKGVQFITHDGGIWTLRNLGLISQQDVKYGSIVIGNNCNISWNVIIMPDVKIGDNCVIAAGAIVTKDVPDGMVYGGVPAKPIQTIDEYYKKVIGNVSPCFFLPPHEKRDYLKKNCPKLFADLS
tara:strand:- start:196 stop:735 length:540 start_codon:yes stop_codon:yes gene_type:complete